jgi:anti-sigma regulatory factor (Ser/Thr protein kinase)
MTVATDDIAVGHVVQFYRHETELTGTTGRYLADTIRAGAVAIAIATQPHRQALEIELRETGIDPAQARRDRAWVTVEAAEALAGLMSDGRIDRRAFRRLIGGLVRAVAAGGRQVRAYGEIVNLLWEAGDVPAAIEVEELWNDLRRQLEFSLLCAYHSGSIERGAHPQAVEQVCGLHSSVTAEFPGALNWPGAARRFVAGAMRRWGYDARLLHDAQLVISELATNAVIHARSPFSVLARCEASGVRVSIRDRSPAKPTVRDDRQMAGSGRGLRLVAELAGDWGVDATGEGKTVWAELLRRRG